MGVEHNTVVFTWGYPVAGRESQAGELHATRIAYFERCKQAGRLQSYESVIFGPYSGDLAGFFIVKGAHADLQWLADDAECQELNMRAMNCLTKTGYLTAFSGKAASDLLSMWAKTLRP